MLLPLPAFEIQLLLYYARRYDVSMDVLFVLVRIGWETMDVVCMYFWHVACM